MKKQSKPAGKAATAAAKKSTKSGQRVTRSTTATRGEVRQQTTHRQGHPK
jgi:hypothetical protein